MAQSPSSTTTGMRVGDTEATRTPIGREIPDSPATLAAASPARLPAAPSQDSINSGLTVGSQVVVGAIKPTDFSSIAGSYAGDHRSNPGDVAKSSLDKAADNGGPRKDAGQFKGSKNESQPAFISTPTGLDSDQGN
ncbi:MAG: hypothetical protein ACLPHP_05215 [Candidatus Sulfotelmatobacter sp.]